MCVELTKKLSRAVVIEGRRWIVSLEPATPESRFDSLVFRQARKRRRITIPLLSARNHAAMRQIDAEAREKKRARKLRRLGGSA